MTTSKTPSGPAGRADHEAGPAVARVYLTRMQVAEIYPFSVHTLAALASQGAGPRFYKPTDKALYLPEDIEAWIAAAVVMPGAGVAPRFAPDQHHQPQRPRPGRGRAAPKPRPPADETPARAGRKSLQPSARSALRQPD